MHFTFVPTFLTIYLQKETTCKQISNNCIEHMLVTQFETFIIVVTKKKNLKFQFCESTAGRIKDFKFWNTQ